MVKAQSFLSVQYLRKDQWCIPAIQQEFAEFFFAETYPNMCPLSRLSAIRAILATVFCHFAKKEVE